MSSDGKRKGHNDDEAESYRPPKLPKTLSEKNSSQRLIVVLEGAGLETAKVWCARCAARHDAKVVAAGDSRLAAEGPSDRTARRAARGTHARGVGGHAPPPVPDMLIMPTVRVVLMALPHCLPPACASLSC